MVLSDVHAELIEVLQRSGLPGELGGENILSNIDDALNRARQIAG